MQNPNIILSAAQPNMLNALSQGTQAATQQANAIHTGKYRNALRAHGAGAVQGNPADIGALAQFDPAAAQGLQAGLLGMQSTRLGMQATQQRMNILSAQEKRAIEAQAANLSAAERQEAVQKTEQAVAMGLAAQTPEQWDEMVTSMGQSHLVGQFANRQMIANQYLSVADVLKGMEAPKPADEYGRYVQETVAAGGQPLDRIGYAQAKKGNGITMTQPDGTVLQIGGGSAQSESPLDPSSASAMLASIDGILSDPALDSSTGVLSVLQNVPGTPQRRFGARVKQLDGQVFLQAFESLKGAGQITEIEGAKATQAIGRLDSAQSAEDYRAALQELRGILAAGISRPQGWVEQQRAQSDLSTPSSPEAANAMTIPEIKAMTADDLARLPIAEMDLTDAQWDALEERAKELGQ